MGELHQIEPGLLLLSTCSPFHDCVQQLCPAPLSLLFLFFLQGIEFCATGRALHVALCIQQEAEQAFAEEEPSEDAAKKLPSPVHGTGLPECASTAGA